MSTDINSKVVGYVSYKPNKGVFCEAGDCLITGSSAALRKYIRFNMPELSHLGEIMETDFREVAIGLEAGEAYAFDSAAYQRLYALAKKAKKTWGLIHPNAARSYPIHIKLVRMNTPTGKTPA